MALLTTDPLAIRIAFSRLPGMNVAMAQQMMARLDTEERFFELSAAQLAMLVGRRHKMLGDDFRRELLSAAEAEARWVSSKGVEVIHYTDPRYPARLAQCADAPVLLYCLGNGYDFNASTMISIVGTRHATNYGLTFTDRLVKTLAERAATPVVIVSGLAYGIDIAAHRAALKYGLPTIAVLAHGLNTIYPAVHRNDAVRIAQEAGAGALITECDTSTVINRGSFLARNRIIAGLSDCTIVMESAAKGGAMATARLAQAYDREVFTLPGRVGDPYSAGCNRLIASNTARMLLSPEDFIENMAIPCKPEEGGQAELPLELTADQQVLLDCLDRQGDCRLSDLSAATAIPVARIMSAMVDLEFKGMIISFPGGLYRRS